MIALDDLIAQRDALLKARASGLSVVQYASGASSRRVEYRSDAEMVLALADLDRRITSFGAGARPTTIRFATSKGL
jgi:hypothetical protein